jgi:hypothetical protein
MGQLILIVAVLATISNIVQGHYLVCLPFWIVISLAAYLRPKYPWGPGGPE